MNAAIIYYSFTGNTKKTCRFIDSLLAENNYQTRLIELKPVNEEKSFFRQCRQAFLRKKIYLKNVTCDLSDFSLLVFASPVWAFTFAPALRSYLEKAAGLQNKNTVCILTFGSGAGAGKALRELKSKVENRQARILFSKLLKGKKVHDENYLKGRLKFLSDILANQS